MRTMSGKSYNGNQIYVEYSPVTDFREAKCRQYNEGSCDRGGFCNFIHPKHTNNELKYEMIDLMYKMNPEYEKAKKER